MDIKISEDRHQNSFTMSYQKVYMNQVHSSSLLCQLAQMWKSQLLCDAIIKTGTVTTKAHRLVLVAACPMLQSMENASVGDHLEVRLAAEIKQDSVNTFLQYLYEGFMMLTEENVRDVEKVARLLQVESIVTCCSDFDKCMRSKMGMLPPGANYKYNFHDQVEFRHVRTTDLQKTVQERMMKRAAEMSRPSSPGHKRQRMHRPSSPPVDVSSLSDHRFSSDRISHVGSTGGPSSRSGYVDHSSMPGVVEIAEDTLELVHTEAPDGGTGPGRGHDQPVVKKSVSVSVASQINRNRELKVVNVTGDCETRTSSKPSPASGPTSRGAITVSPLTIPVDSSSLSRESSSFSKTPDSANQSNVEIPDFSQSESFMFSTPHSDSSSQRSPFPVSLSQASMSSSHGPKQFSSPSQGSSKMSKPFAAGSAMQSGYSSSQSYSQSPSNRQQPQQRPEKNESIDRPSSASSDGKQSLSGNIKSDQSESGSADMTPDLSIVKVEAGQRNQVEPSDTGGLDMYVDMHGQGVMHMQRQEDDEDAGETSDIEYEEPSGEWSNEGSNLSADQSASWHSGSFKESYSLSL
ncbi:hypothetical protein KUTeg_023003 [Tegillarca granosa]|uniref:BTB domain-containing protein n=1 Tax=Tegillarca granosa TaxID=220873 RepID=A0ABQ9E0E2_TEGGR|nr:hypothetical protein KUTeg_023003 [Tegillarca granosa]